MNYVIDQFMWGYQRHFQISLQVFAERVFSKLDPHLQPKTFLIGIRKEELGNRHEICLEPEDCGYIQGDFKNVRKLAAQLELVDPELKIIHTHPIAEKNHRIRIKNNALRDAILKIIQRSSVYSDLLTYASSPTEKEGYSIFVVLQISKSAYESHYRLSKEKSEEHYRISVSLINSTINKFLEAASHELYVPDAGAGLDFSKYEGDEVIKAAGKDFMYTVSSKGKALYGLYGLWDVCNIISSLTYEREGGIGGIIIAPRGHQNIKMSLILDNPIKISEYRKIRKFLELSDQKNYLISDSYLVYGLGQTSVEYNPINEDLFLVNFTQHYHWEVSHAGNCLMKVSYNQPHLPRTKINRKKFYSDLERIFKKIKRKDLDNLWSIVNEALKQKHGTMLVVSEKAKDEAKRLANQCFTIKPTALNEETIKINKITSIDGAVLLSPDGICHAIGVILDGLATEKGSSARGARYNSAIRYYENVRQEPPCIIIIISEDGMADFVPDLMPQIKRSLIIERIHELEELDKSDKIKVKDFNITLDWLEQHRFYLSQDQCDEINNLRTDIEKKLEKQLDTDYIKIVRYDLKPNSEMNESYLID